MADNFLENHRAEYELRKAKWLAKQKKHTPASVIEARKKENAKETKAQIDELLSWAECFEKADIGTKHLIVARLVERVDVSTGYKVHIKFRISLKQFLGQE